MENTNCYSCNTVTSSIFYHMYPSIPLPPFLLYLSLAYFNPHPPLCSLHSQPQPSSFFLSSPQIFSSFHLFTSHINMIYPQSRLLFVSSLLFMLFYCFPLLNFLSSVFFKAISIPLLPLANPPFFISLSCHHLLFVVSSFGLSTVLFLPTLLYTILFYLLSLRQIGNVLSFFLFSINLVGVEAHAVKCAEELDLSPFCSKKRMKEKVLFPCFHPVSWPAAMRAGEQRREK